MLKSIEQTLTKSLTKLCKEKPTNPIVFFNNKKGIFSEFVKRNEPKNIKNKKMNKISNFTKTFQNSLKKFEGFFIVFYCFLLFFIVFNKF